MLVSPLMLQGFAGAQDAEPTDAAPVYTDTAVGVVYEDLNANNAQDAGRAGRAGRVGRVGLQRP